jgi:hypothetical protein
MPASAPMHWRYRTTTTATLRLIGSVRTQTDQFDHIDHHLAPAPSAHGRD